MGEHTVEATSARVPGTLAHGDELWNSCLDDLMTATRTRLEHEVVRLGGDYAHVLDESIEPRHDQAKGRGCVRKRDHARDVAKGAVEPELPAEREAFGSKRL